MMPSIMEILKKTKNSKFGEKENLYDYESAIKGGASPDKTKHWPSRVAKGPNEGLLLKHETHPTFWKTMETEKAGGYKIYRAPDDRLYSYPKEKVVPTYMDPYDPNISRGGGS